MGGWISHVLVLVVSKAHQNDHPYDPLADQDGDVASIPETPWIPEDWPEAPEATEPLGPPVSPEPLREIVIVK